MKPKIGITIGDSNGIGPEIILKLLANHNLEQSTPIVIGQSAIIEFYSRLLGLSFPYKIIDNIEQAPEDGISVLEIERTSVFAPTPGKLISESGLLAMQAIEKATEFCIKGMLDAMVTAPISKEAVNLAGYYIPGHTEFLAEKTNTSKFLMTLVSGNLRVALVAGHVPIKEVAQCITTDRILEDLRVLNQSLRIDFGIKEPKIAVLGLNPHAGDGGVIGNEEIDIIAPALKIATQNGINCTGPFPADGFFGQQSYKNYDAILAMYHDQGLAPFKLLSFGKGVNFTAGLPIIRTSPDHGTAFDIAGKNKASESSLLEAYQLAVKLAAQKI